MPKKTTVLCVAPDNNPHITPIYDEMTRQPGIDVTRVCLRRLSRRRVKMGWSEMPQDTPYLQPWRRLSDKVAYYKALIGSDVIIMPGFCFKTLPLHYWARRLTGKPTLFWSEAPLGGRPRQCWRWLVHRLLIKSIDTPGMHLLSIGFHASGEFAAMGATRWNHWLFAYAVEPQPRLDRDLGIPPQGDVQVVYSGQLSARKRVDLILSALSRPDLVKGRWHFTVVGDGPRRAQLESAVTELGIVDKVTFLGAIPMRRCRAVYAKSHVLILPSRFDGWGAVVNEAMEAGLAIITSDTVGAAALIDPGRNGYVFRNGNADDLAGYLKKLFRDPGLVAQMGLASRQRIIQFRPGESARRLALLCRGVARHTPMPDFQDGLCSPMNPKPRALKDLCEKWLATR